MEELETFFIIEIVKWLILVFVPDFEYWISKQA